jgi:hypothetical protein
LLVTRLFYLPDGPSISDAGEYAGAQGLGLLRLHSTFRHDLKIYASDEGRVQMTAAAFAKGLLALEGELTPILVQMVKSANTNGLLDNDCDSSKYQNMYVSKVNLCMWMSGDIELEVFSIYEKFLKRFVTTRQISIILSAPFDSPFDYNPFLIPLGY